MPQRTCVIGDCPNTRKRQGGRCETHYRHAVAAGEIALPVKPCSVNGCAEPEFCAVLCAKHYKRAQRRGTTDEPATAHAEFCGLEDCDEPYYASDRCCRHYKREYAREVRARAKAWRDAVGPQVWTCIDCGRLGLYHYRGRVSLRCKGCAAEAAYATRRAWALEHAPPRVLEYECHYCGCLFCNLVPDGRPRTVCAGCQGTMRARSTRRWQAAHPDQAARHKAASQQRRRALIWDSAADYIERDVVFERDEWRCHLCCGDIDRTRAYPDPWSASLDHVIPLSKDGTHTYDNVAASHWLCNIRRGDRLLVT